MSFTTGSDVSPETGIRQVLVVHPHMPNLVHKASGHHKRLPEAELEEAVGLTRAIHVDIAMAQVMTVRRVSPRTLLGGGQIDQIREQIAEHNIGLMIVNHTLSPSQQRNLERALDIKVIDRTALILEIFGERARTAEGKLQVELAALNYQKSRLVRSWTHLERQRGGFGFMGGPGESQIETDRRLIAERIDKIKRQLEKVVRTRGLHRKTRRDIPYPLIALVGYTNAGKSTLFNRLTNANVEARDMLFATLDPTIRKMTLPGGQEVMLSDTVGFISNLPHELVAAFRATLEEVLEADLIVHVRDISHPDNEAQKEDVNTVLTSLFGKDWQSDRIIEAWNKIDQLESVLDLPKPGDGQIILSGLTGQGCDALLYAINQKLTELHCVTRDYHLSAADGEAAAWLHAHAQVIQQDYQNDRARYTVQISPQNVSRFERWMAQRSASAKNA